LCVTVDQLTASDNTFAGV